VTESLCDEVSNHDGISECISNERDYNLMSNRENDFKRYYGKNNYGDHILAQEVSARKGFKLYGERAVDAIMYEYKQMVTKDVFISIDVHGLSNDQKRGALRVVNLIKHKRCGKIKGRTCADGSKESGYISKEETSSPTVGLEALLTTLVIDAS
jgi:hypothetical protein